MDFFELTMPLSHQWMPDEVLPTAVKFFLGPKNHQEKGIALGSDTGAYVLQSPHFSIEAAQYLGERMTENESDLLLVDTALLGWPGRYLIPEWCSMLPTPPIESGEA